MKTERETSEKALALRALAAASDAASRLGGGLVVACAEAAIRVARSAVAAAPGPGLARYTAADAAKEARQAFTDLLRNCTDIPEAAGMAVQAAVSACACYARGDGGEARRLAHNALRFATEASGGTVDWTVES